MRRLAVGCDRRGTCRFGLTNFSGEQAQGRGFRISARLGAAWSCCVELSRPETALISVEARRLHLLAGCSSLYDYCRKRLLLSDYEAFVRIAAARVARKYLVVFEMLERRELHLTAICEVRDFLTAENHAELLGEISGKTFAGRARFWCGSHGAMCRGQ